MRSIHKIFLSMMLISCAASPSLNAAEHTKDSMETVKKNVTQKKAVLVDVRELSEWKQGHLKESVLVPLSQIRRADRKWLEKKIPVGKIVYLHCRSGKRVLVAGDILKKQGYDVRPLKQGYQALLNGPFEKAEGTD